MPSDAYSLLSGWPACLQFYARGLFASPLVTSWRGTPQPGLADQLWGGLWGAVTVVHSLLDWPLRNLSGEWCCCAG